MAHDISVTIKAGSEVEGVVLKHDLRERLFPNASDADVLHSLRAWMRNQLKSTVQMQLVGDLSAEAEQIVTDNTQDVS